MWCDSGVRSRVPVEVWRALASEGMQRSFQTGHRLIIEGVTDTRVFVLTEGRVKVTSNEEDGTEVLLAIRGAGDIVGERAAIDQGLRSATVTALRPCTTRVLSAREFMHFVDAHDLGMTMLRLAVSRQRESQQIRVELSTLSVSRRLVRVLLRLVQAVDGGAVGPVAVDLGMPQEELARAIGASRGQVAAHLSRLRAAGIVSTSRRRIVVLDPDRLYVLDCGQPLTRSSPPAGSRARPAPGSSSP
jgi:CRP/FNR family cyclic AMP-dependent transcriptional regulator